MVSDMPLISMKLVKRSVCRVPPCHSPPPLPFSYPLGSNANAKRSIKMIPATVAPLLQVATLDSVRNLFKFVSRTYALRVRVCVRVCDRVCVAFVITLD